MTWSAGEELGLTGCRRVRESPFLKCVLESTNRSSTPLICLSDEKNAVLVSWNCDFHLFTFRKPWLGFSFCFSCILLSKIGCCRYNWIFVFCFLWTSDFIVTWTWISEDKGVAWQLNRNICTGTCNVISPLPGERAEQVPVVFLFWFVAGTAGCRGAVLLLAQVAVVPWTLSIHQGGPVVGSTQVLTQMMAPSTEVLQTMKYSAFGPGKAIPCLWLVHSLWILACSTFHSEKKDLGLRPLKVIPVLKIYFK